MLDSELLFRAKSKGSLGIPRFQVRAVKNDARSEKEGRACFDDVEFVEVFHPGDIKTRPCFPVTEHYKELFREAYDHWKKTQENRVPGTPLAMWPRMTASRVEELKSVGVTTVEQLAALSDDVVGKYNLTKDKAAAALYLKPENEAIRELRMDKEKQAAELEELKARLAQIEGKKK